MTIATISCWVADVCIDNNTLWCTGKQINRSLHSQTRWTTTQVSTKHLSFNA